MPAPRFRSRTMRRVAVRTPGAKNVTHYRRRKNARPQCADCGSFLIGVARGSRAQVKAIPRSQRRPERPYGGKLCSKCTRRTLIASVRE